MPAPSLIHESRIDELEASIEGFRRKGWKLNVCAKLGADLWNDWPHKLTPDGYVIDEAIREIHCYEVGHRFFIGDARMNDRAAQKWRKYSAIAAFIKERTGWTVRVL